MSENGIEVEKRADMFIEKPVPVLSARSLAPINSSATRLEWIVAIGCWSSPCICAPHHHDSAAAVEAS